MMVKGNLRSSPLPQFDTLHPLLYHTNPKNTKKIFRFPEKQFRLTGYLHTVVQFTRLRFTRLRLLLAQGVPIREKIQNIILGNGVCPQIPEYFAFFARFCGTISEKFSAIPEKSLNSKVVK